MSCVTLYFLLLFILFPSVLSSLIKLPFFLLFMISMFLYVKLFVQQKSYLFKLLQKKNPFLSFLFHQKTSFSLFPFLLGFLKIKFFFPCLVFFCVLKNDFSFCISLLFLLHLLNTFCFLLSFLLKYKKRTLFWMENGAKTVFCFLFLFSWFQKHVVSEKNPFYFPLFLIFCINSSLSLHLKPLKILPKHLHFLFLFRPFFVSLVYFQHFSWFSIITFSLFTFSFHPFVHPFLLFSPFSFLSFLHSFFVSLSQCFSFFFFCISCFLIFFLHRRCCVSTFCFNSLFFSLFCSWCHFSFHTSSLPCFSSSPYLFFLSKIFKNFCGQFFLMKFCLCFLNPPFFEVSFFPPCVVLIPCLFHVLLIISVSWYYFSWFSFINLLFGSLKINCRFVFGQKFQKISLILF